MHELVNVSFDLIEQRVVDLFVAATEHFLHADGDMCVWVPPLWVAI